MNRLREKIKRRKKTSLMKEVRIVEVIEKCFFIESFLINFK